MIRFDYLNRSAPLLNSFRNQGLDSHSQPRTRREFLQLGLLQFSGLMLGSSLTRTAAKGASLAFVESSMAQNPIQRDVPFLVFDLAGGAAMPGNFLVGGDGGSEDLIEDYRTHGWNPRASGAIDRTFGLPMAAQVSQMLAGIKETLPAALQDHLKMGSLCSMSENDVATNTLSAVHLISKARPEARYLSASFGDRNSESGGNSRSFLPAAYAPSIVQVVGQDTLRQFSDFGLIGRNESHLISEVLESDRDFLARLTPNGSVSNPKLRGNELSDQLTSLLDAKMFDPFQNADVRNLYANNNDSESAIEAIVAYNTLQGNCRSGVLTDGECDYHNGTTELGATIDRRIGRRIGRVVAMASILKTPLFFQIVTDGGMVASGFDRRWTGDSRIHSLTVLGYFDPLTKPKLRKTQVGAYEKSGAVDTSKWIAKKDEHVALATLVNYLHIVNRVGETADILGNQSLATQSIDDSILFD